MILDKLLELEAFLDREKVEAIAMAEIKFGEYREWREHAEKRTLELLELKQIIENARKPKQYLEED